MNKILEIKNVGKRYHNLKTEILAIKDINLDVLDGEYLAIVGPSGCGKSTLLNIIGCIDTKSFGEIKIADNKQVGYMLQEDCLFSWLTVLDNCLLGLKINKLLTEDNINYVNYLLDNYGLKDFKDKYPSDLSGGMRQRVG